MHSRLKSARPPQISFTASTGFSRASTTCVAPSSCASFSLFSWRSIATIVVAPVHRAAMIAARPTEPVPYTTTLDPSPGRSTFRIAPAPVPIPQASGPRSSSGRSSATGTSAFARTIECVAKADWPKKWLCSGDPSTVASAVEPSARFPPAMSGPIWRQ